MAMLPQPAARSAASSLVRALPRVRGVCNQYQSLQPRIAMRHKSGPYGYTQAKALVFSKYGEPSDALR